MPGVAGGKSLDVDVPRAHDDPSAAPSDGRGRTRTAAQYMKCVSTSPPAVRDPDPRRPVPQAAEERREPITAEIGRPDGNPNVRLPDGEEEPPDRPRATGRPSRGSKARERTSPGSEPQGRARGRMPRCAGDDREERCGGHRHGRVGQVERSSAAAIELEDDLLRGRLGVERQITVTANEKRARRKVVGEPDASRLEAEGRATRCRGATRRSRRRPADGRRRPTVRAAE